MATKHLSPGHLVLLVALLVGGCKRDGETEQPAGDDGGATAASGEEGGAGEEGGDEPGLDGAAAGLDELGEQMEVDPAKPRERDPLVRTVVTQADPDLVDLALIAEIVERLEPVELHVSARAPAVELEQVDPLRGDGLRGGEV